MTHTWESLNAATLARQFPMTDLPPVALADRIGPMQTQTARSAFIGLGARSTQATYESVTAAYEAAELVRGSSLRGTVHTSTAAVHRQLDAVTRVGLLPLWRRHLGDPDEDMTDVWSGLEQSAEEWRTPAQLRAQLSESVGRRHGRQARERFESDSSRYLAVSHSGLVRRPLTGDWTGQGAPAYRDARQVTGLPLPQPQRALPELVRAHLAAHGPASRHDLAWWSGLTLRTVDEVVAAFADELVVESGPDGRDYLDLRETPPARTLSDVRLLPEFDAIFCAYDPKARRRFITPNHQKALWNSANGLVLPALLVDGRVAGYWRATGSARRRPMTVTVLPGMRRPRREELAGAVSRLETSLGITITELVVERG